MVMNASRNVLFRWVWCSSMMLSRYNIGIAAESCVPNTTIAFTLELETDESPEETTWSIINSSSGRVYASNGPYEDKWTVHNETYCLNVEECFLFQIEDTYEDFLSYYKLFYNGKLIKETRGDFGRREQVIFGTTCATSSPTLSATIVTRTPTKYPSINPTMYPTTSHSPSTVSRPQTSGFSLMIIISFPIVAVLLILLFFIIYMYLTGNKRKEFEAAIS